MDELKDLVRRFPRQAEMAEQDGLRALARRHLRIGDDDQGHFYGSLMGIVSVALYEVLEGEGE
jgi:hypothetical protein